MMAWEHLILGNLEPAEVEAAVIGATADAGLARGFGPLESQCELLAELGRTPDADPDWVRERFPAVDVLRLPGSGIVVTQGELNVLPDYLSHPDRVLSGPPEFLLSVVQSIRAQSLVQLARIMRRRRGASRPRLPGSLRYSRQRWMSELYEAIQVTSLGRRCGLPDSELYPSVIGRNATHFAPFSWYRWQTLHLAARDMIGRSAAMSAASPARERLRTRARIYAGYADHFLQDSFAAGHLINKTLVMQWYAEWLTQSRLPVGGRQALAEMTQRRQPLLHGPSLYGPQADHESTETPCESSLPLLNSALVQSVAARLHGHLNRRSLAVASASDTSAYRIWGDRVMFTASPEAATAARHAATAASSSRRAISGLLTTGETDISVREIFASFPSLVEVDGTLLPLPDWHRAALRDWCFQEFFPRWDTQTTRLILMLCHPRLAR